MSEAASDPGSAKPAVEVADSDDERSRHAREAFRAKAAAAGGRPARADLLTLAASLAGQAMMHLGVVPHPLTKAVKRDLGQARFTIDLLGVLEDKTAGNRTAEEERVLRSLLADLRLRYVQAV